MIISVDIETQGLDATKFVMGSIVDQDMKSKVFYDKNEMWQHIIKLGHSQAKQGKVLYVYAHNHQFDFYGYADLANKHLRWLCENPFIVDYMDYVKGRYKKIICFLDTYSIFKMSLKDLGELTGLPKLELTEEQMKDITKVPKAELEAYNIRDSEIVVKAIEVLKKLLKEENTQVKTLYTQSQIAINHVLKMARDEPGWENLFFNRERMMVWKPNNRDKIHDAYRGARNVCWRYGAVEKATYIDCNSLYPYALCRMPFPDLRTQETVMCSKEGYLNNVIDKIGIVRALMYNKSNELGVLPVRTSEKSGYYPKSGKYMIGTWTNWEVKKALQEGYKLIEVDWAITWQEADRNPLKPVFEKMYAKKAKEKEGFKRNFYKGIMNFSIGKFGQTKITQEMVLDDVEMAQKYVDDNWRIVKGVGDTEYMYQKEVKEEDAWRYLKPFYAPIIPSLVCAWARLYMYDIFKQVPVGKRLYTDTDSLVLEGHDLGKIKIGSKMGEFKVEHLDVPYFAYGGKAYKIGTEIKVATVHKADVSAEKFGSGVLLTRKIVTMKEAHELGEVGTFREEVLDLKERQVNAITSEELLDAQQIYIDNGILDIRPFRKAIESIPDGKQIP